MTEMTKEFRKTGVVHFNTWEKAFLGTCFAALFSIPVLSHFGWLPHIGADSAVTRMDRDDKEISNWSFEEDQAAVVVEADRNPAGTKTTKEQQLAAIDKKRAQALFFFLARLSDAAKAAGKPTLVNKGEYLWKAATALNAGKTRDARIFLAGFFLANENNDYIKYIQNSQADLSEFDLKVVRNVLFELSGEVFKKAAARKIRDLQLRVRMAYNGYSVQLPDGRKVRVPGVNDYATQKDQDGVVSTYLGGASSLAGWNRSVTDGLEKFDAMMDRFAAYLKGTSPMASFEFIQQSHLLDLFVEAAALSIEERKSVHLKSWEATLHKHVALIETSFEYFQMTKTFASFKASQKGNLAAQASKVFDKFLDLKNDIWADENRSTNWAPYVQYVGGIAAGTAAAVLVISTAGAAFPALGIAGTLPTITAAGSVIGVGYMATAGTALLEQGTRSGGFIQSQEDYRTAAMNGLMFAAMGLGRVANVYKSYSATRAATQLQTALSYARVGNYTAATAAASKGAAMTSNSIKIIKGLAVADMGVNMLFTADQTYTSAYMFKNAKKLAKESGRSEYEINYEASMQGIFVLLGSLQMKISMRQLRDAPNLAKEVYARYEANDYLNSTRGGKIAKSALEKLHEAKQRGDLSSFDKAIDILQKDLPGMSDKVSEAKRFHDDFLYDSDAMSSSNAKQTAQKFAEKFEQIILDHKKKKIEAELSNRIEEAVEYGISIEIHETALKAAKRAANLAPVYASFRAAEGLSEAAEAAFSVGERSNVKTSDAGVNLKNFRNAVKGYTDAVAHYSHAKKKLAWIIAGFEKTVGDRSKLAEIPEYTQAVKALAEIDGADGKLALAQSKLNEAKQQLANAQKPGSGGTRQKPTETGSSAEGGVAAAGRADGAPSLLLAKIQTNPGIPASKRAALAKILKEPASYNSLVRLINTALARKVPEAAIAKALVDSTNACLR